MNLGDPRLPERFWARVQCCPANGCWLWTGVLKRGYGSYGKHGSAHRTTYITEFGDVPTGLELDHRACQTKSCCNPHHLEAVTHAVNVARGRLGLSNSLRHQDRTHCSRGHEYAAHGARHKNGRRFCRACSNKFGNERAKAKRLERGHITNSKKLTRQMASEIHERLRLGERPTDISILYGVTPTTISNIKSGKTWSHARAV